MGRCVMGRFVMGRFVCESFLLLIFKLKYIKSWENSAGLKCLLTFSILTEFRDKIITNWTHFVSGFSDFQFATINFKRGF
jgi:hypothetical protein